MHQDSSTGHAEGAAADDGRRSKLFLEVAAK